MENINRNQLFIASCVALTVTSMTFAIRAGMLGTLGEQFGLTTQQLGYIAGTAFWGFPLAVIIGGMLVDAIGMKKLMYAAFASHVLGIGLTIISGGFWGLFISTLLIGIANGLVEAVCNPLIASMYPENKTTKLNHFHIWFPGGLVIGGLVAYFLGQAGIGWQVQMATMLVPAVLYGYLLLGKTFPVTERVAKGISTSEMYRSLAQPLFIVLVICMLGIAVTELGTNQWIDLLLRSVTDNALLLLVFISINNIIDIY
jgi:MFS family permease